MRVLLVGLMTSGCMYYSPGIGATRASQSTTGERWGAQLYSGVGFRTTSAARLRCGGACGYLSYAGDMDVAIAIRTGIIKDGTLYVQAAAGVVADSVPEMEWRETEHKARALLRAAELVEEGLE